MATIQSALGLLTIDKARSDELNIVMGILDEAAAWLVAKGIQQWQSPPPQGLWNLIKREIDKGQVYLARANEDHSPVGTLRFEWTNKALWSDESDSAGYVYSLATRISIHGYKIGATLIDWAKAHVKSKNRKYLRLDCPAKNLAMRRYYEGLGFRYCGQATYRDYTAALYERAL